MKNSNEDADPTQTIDLEDVTSEPERPDSAPSRAPRATPPPLPPEAISMAPSPPVTPSFVPGQASVAPAPPARNPLVYVAILAGALVLAITAGWLLSRRAPPPAAAAPGAPSPSVSAPSVITIPTVEMGNE